MNRSKFLKILAALPFIAPLLGKTQERRELGKTIFTPEMLKRYNYGLYIINTRATDVRLNPGYAATVSWKLCYQVSSFKRIHDKHMSKYCKVNFLTDGWVCPIGDTDEEVCEYLNNNPYGQSFRVMTKEEVLYLITERQQGFL